VEENTNLLAKWRIKVNELLAHLSGIAAVFITGTIKHGLGKVDAKLTNKIFKPSQPVVAGAIAVGLPLIANMIGLSSIPDAEVFMRAPATTLATITALEALKKIKKED
jgi:hypothetical protein